MLYSIINVYLKLFDCFLYNYIIYARKKLNTYFMSKIKVFFQYSKINRIANIQKFYLTNIWYFDSKVTSMI